MTLMLCRDKQCPEPHSLVPDFNFPDDPPFWTCAAVGTFWVWAAYALRNTQDRPTVEHELRLFFLKQLDYKELGTVAQRLIHEF